MRTLTTLIAATVALSLLAAPVGAQQAKSGSDGEAMKLARELTQPYVVAYNAHDVAKLATMFTPDADWISFLGDQLGTHLDGRAAIEQRYRDSFAESPQIRLKVTTEHARLVTPGVLIGDYSWSVTNSTRTDVPLRGWNTAASVRRDGRWLIRCFRLVMTPPSGTGR
jgi:uncharacterized protein (TIGR02246 family)